MSSLKDFVCKTAVKVMTLQDIAFPVGPFASGRAIGCHKHASGFSTLVDWVNKSPCIS